MSARVTSSLLLTLLVAACDNSTTLPFAPTPVVPAPSNAPPVVGFGGPFGGNGHPLAVGETVAGTVLPDDVRCFPNWDSTSPCQRFTLTAPHAGVLKARATWGGGRDGSVGDLFIVDEQGRWEVSAEAAPKDVQMRVEEGRRYDVLVMSYPPPGPLEFELTVDLAR